MPNPLPRVAGLLALIVALAGCRNSTSPAVDDITIVARADGLEIVNSTDEPIYSMAVDEGTLALIDFAFCSPHCPVQQPAERRVVPWTSILGYSEDRSTYVVYWAHATVAADGTIQLGPVHNAHVKR